MYRHAAPVLPALYARRHQKCSRSRQCVRVPGQVLSQLDRLDSFPDLDEEAQVELIRAARAYAAGLWWSNEDQNLAWLQLVTAVEIAANHRQKVRAAPQELVEDLWPELWSAVQSAS